MGARKVTAFRLRLKDEIRQSVEGKRLAVFLDYDGTLTPIVENPEDARLSESIRDAVRELASLCDVAIVSGRDREDVEGLVQLNHLVYAGSHGFDVAGPHGLRMEHKEAKACLSSLNAAEKELREQLTDVPGVWVERKGYAVAVHYRKTPKGHERTVRKRVNDAASKHPDLRPRGGKKVIELQPDLNWDKGKAVLWLLGALERASPDVMPVYLGDDLTDEDAFRALAGRGLRFVVGPLEHRSEADYYLKDVHEVEGLLRELTESLRKGNE